MNTTVLSLLSVSVHSALHFITIWFSSIFFIYFLIIQLFSHVCHLGRDPTNPEGEAERQTAGGGADQQDERGGGRGGAASAGRPATDKRPPGVFLLLVFLSETFNFPYPFVCRPSWTPPLKRAPTMRHAYLRYSNSSKKHRPARYKEWLPCMRRSDRWCSTLSRCALITGASPLLSL